LAEKRGEHLSDGDIVVDDQDRPGAFGHRTIVPHSTGAAKMLRPADCTPSLAIEGGRQVTMDVRMAFREWMFLFAAVGHLALGIVSLTRSRQSVVARPLALLCFALFSWNFADLAEHVSQNPTWSVLDAVFTALSPPLMLYLVASFVGVRRERVRIIAFVSLVFGALGLSSTAGFFATWGREWSNSMAWATIFLTAWVPTLATALAWLVRHLGASIELEEKARTRTFLAAIAFAGALATTDELATLGLAVPQLASLGTLAGTFLVATAVFRFRLLDRDLSISTAVYAVALASAGLVAYLAVYRLFGGSVAALGVVTATLTFVLAAATREVVLSRTTQRERFERLAALGRLSTQMAHDIKNPLAAMLGAARVLEDAPTDQPQRQRQFVRLMVEQAERIRAIVDRYERIGRVEPVATRVPINDVVRRVVSAQRLTASGVEVVLELLEPSPECDADPDLVASALENVVRNAFEAMPSGGALRVRTRVDNPAAGTTTVVVRVEDTGEGMDVRRAERAFDDFYTTKATGSGLGLAFVRRVAMAHGGNVSLASRPGEGTVVELRLPTAAPTPSG
jgi:signal transduction histidine kinase